MDNKTFPITPPPELVEQWAYALESQTDTAVFTQAANWGADIELDACCEYMQHEDFHGFAKELRAARRPKPSLAKRALHILGSHGDLSPAEHDRIRRALEQLDD